MSRQVSKDLGGRESVFGPLHENLVGESPFINELRNVIQHVAKTNLNVLITGETGTGKDIVARLLHRSSDRRDKPFVKVSCPALPNELIESELFGYEKGTFTGAYTSKPGRFELARDGTIFLDEISEICQASQAKLIQVLDGEPFMRIGGVEAIYSTARVIAATNLPVEEAMEIGRLRKDICFRLNEFLIHMLPLRERPEDIRCLAEHFNFNFSKRINRDYRPLPSELIENMRGRLWPGNVRELAARVREYLATGKESVLADEDMGAVELVGTTSRGVNNESFGKEIQEEVPERSFISLKTAARNAVRKTERVLIEDALRYTLWNRRKAAKLLKTSYSSLLRRIETYDIGKP